MNKRDASRPEGRPPFDPDIVSGQDARLSAGRQRLVPPASGPHAERGFRIVRLNFEAVYMDADIWVNGEHLKKHHYGYTANRIRNLVAVDGDLLGIKRSTGGSAVASGTHMLGTGDGTGLLCGQLGIDSARGNVTINFQIGIGIRMRRRGTTAPARADESDEVGAVVPVAHPLAMASIIVHSTSERTLKPPSMIQIMSLSRYRSLRNRP